MFMRKIRAGGFTLIELLVVIAIISLLSSTILASLNVAKNKAEATRSQSDMRQIRDAVVLATGETGKFLKDITEKIWTEESCVCPGGYDGGICNGEYTDLRQIAPTDSCYLNWASALSRIEAASNGNVKGLSAFNRDLWGSPYLLDENDGEFVDCRPDKLRSAGHDGRPGYPSDEEADDLTIYIPLSRPCSP